MVLWRLQCVVAFCLTILLQLLPLTFGSRLALCVALGVIVLVSGRRSSRAPVIEQLYVDTAKQKIGLANTPGGALNDCRVHYHSAWLLMLGVEHEGRALRLPIFRVLCSPEDYRRLLAVARSMVAIQ